MNEELLKIKCDNCGKLRVPDGFPKLRKVYLDKKVCFVCAAQMPREWQRAHVCPSSKKKLAAYKHLIRERVASLREEETERLREKVTEGLSDGETAVNTKNSNTDLTDKTD